MALFKKISFKLKELEERFIQSKLLIIILPVILILVLILYSAPLILNNNQLKEELEMEFAQQLNAELKINGEVKTSLFPTPNITFNNLYLRNLFTGSRTVNLHVSKAKVNLSIMSVILSNFDIKNIEANDVSIEIISSSKQHKEAKSQKLKKLISQSQLNMVRQKGIAGNLFSIDSLALKNENFFSKINFKVNNLNLIYFSKLGNKKELSNITINSKINKNSIFADGHFYNQDSINNFSVKLFSAITKKQSIISLKSESYDFLASGTFSSSRNSDSEGFFDNFKGDATMTIFNLKSFLKSFFNQKSRVYKRISDNSNPISLSSKIEKQNKQIEILNCEIQSEIANGIADIYFGYDTKVPILDTQLNFSFIDFDKIIAEKSKKNNIKTSDQIAIKEVKEDDDKKDEIATSKTSEDMRDIDLNLELKIDKATYLLEEVTDISIYSAISKNGEVLILPLKFKTPGNGNFRITGILDSRDNNSKFLGKIDGKGDNLSSLMNWLGIKFDNLKTNDLNGFAIYSDIFLKPSVTSFDNLYININDGPEILGESNFYYHSNPYAISTFNILNFDLEKFFQTSIKNTYLSPGSLLKKTLWLANIDLRNDINLKINNLKTKNSTFNTNSFKIRLGRGYFELDKMKIQTADTDLDNQEDLTTSIALQIKESISSFNIAFESENFSIMEPRSDLNLSIIDKNNTNLTNLFFSLPSIENFSGKISADLKNLTINDNKFKNTKIKGEIDSGVVKFSQFRSLVNDGRLNFNGSIAVKFDKTISGNITLGNFPINSLLKNTYNIESVDGVANVSSSISSFGSSASEFISNLDLKAKYNAANILIKNFGLNTLIQKMFNAKNYHQELDKASDILRSNIESTILQKASGTLAVNKRKDDIFTSKFSGTAFNGIFNSNFSTVANTGSGQSKIIFLTGTKSTQIPINIASNFQGAIDDLTFTDNTSQADDYIDRAKKFYSNPKNRNRDLLKKPSKKKKNTPQVQDNKNKTAIINQQQPSAIPQGNFDPALMNQIMQGNYPISKEMQQQINQMQSPR